MRLNWLLNFLIIPSSSCVFSLVNHITLSHSMSHVLVNQRNLLDGLGNILPVAPPRWEISPLIKGDNSQDYCRMKTGMLEWRTMTLGKVCSLLKMVSIHCHLGYIWDCVSNPCLRRPAHYYYWGNNKIFLQLNLCSGSKIKSKENDSVYHRLCCVELLWHRYLWGNTF